MVAVKVGAIKGILAEGAIALSVTLSGGVLFASLKLLQFPFFDRQSHSCNFHAGLGPTIEAKRSELFRSVGLVGADVLV